MEKLNQEREVTRDAEMLYRAIMSGLSYSAAVIQTNVFNMATFEHQEAVLRETITRLQVAPPSQKNDGIKQAQEGVRDAILNLSYYDSPQRQRQLDQQLEKSIARDASTTSSQYRLTREAPVHYFTSIDGTTARVTGVSKELEEQLPEEE